MKDFTPTFVHLCDAATIDSLGKLNILGIFNRIFLQELPRKFPKMTVVIDLALSKSVKKNHVLKLSIKGLNKEELKTSSPIEIKFDLPDKMPSAGTPHINIIVEIPNIEFTAYGEHNLVVFVDGENIGKREFIVEKPPKKV